MSSSFVLRFALALLAASLAAIGIAFLLGHEWATSLWPTSEAWPDRLAQFFTGAVLVSIGAGAGYVAWSGDLRSGTPGAMSLACVFAALAVALTVVPWPLARAAFMPNTAAFAALAILAVGLATATVRVPPLDARMAPPWVRAAMAATAAALVFAGALLVAGVPNVLPWDLQSLNAILYGCIFLGLSINSAASALTGRLADARVSQIAFLLYDALFIVPLIQRFATVPDEQFTSLCLLTAAVILSALIAVAVLTFDLRTARTAKRLPQPV